MHTETSLTPIAQEQLAQHGWQRRCRSAIASKSIASKCYDTAVGIKEAFVYLHEGASDDPNMIIAGHYESEGRNILAPSGKLIPKGCSEGVAIELINAFAREVDEVVAASYAARLLRAA